MPELNSRREQFAALNAQVLDISVDSIPSHLAWQRKEIGMMEIPLCADFFPHGEVTEQFAIMRVGAPVPGISERAAFILDKKGRIRFAKVYPLDELPDIEEILSVLKGLHNGQ